jgi:poly-gamma-glutamate capsule biosynthesis protein CapA/YwtB (metallophosphatase superfamily)
VRRRDFLLSLSAFLASQWRATSRWSPLAGAEELTSLPESSALLAAAGDTVLGYNLEAHFDAQLEAGASREQLWPLYCSGVAGILHRADAVVVNLECPFTEQGVMIPKNFNFRARPELIEILKAGRIDVVTLANNHTMDYGVVGLQDTFRTLKEAGIAHFGAGMTLGQARRPAIVERQGLTIGFLGYYFQTAADMLEPRELFATKTQAGVAGCYVDPRCIRQLVKEDVSALIPSVDAVIVYFHWGKEGSLTVQEYQIRLAHLCIDLGCKAVLGAHPHRFQGVEVYREAPIFYSLGNFVYGGRKDPQDKLSAIALLRLSKNQPVTTELIPIQFTRWPEAPYQPIVLVETERDQALERIAALSAGFPATLPVLESYRKLDAPGIQLPP